MSDMFPPMGEPDFWIGMRVRHIEDGTVGTVTDVGWLDTDRGVEVRWDYAPDTDWLYDYEIEEID